MNVSIAVKTGRIDFWIKSLFTGLWFTLSLLRPAARTTDTSWAAIIIATSHTALLTFFIGYGEVLSLPVGWGLVLIGSLFCAISWLSIGKAFGILPALRILRERGAYRFVRHPIYLSYLITAMGSVLLSFSPYNLVWLLALILLTTQRIALEEKLLSRSSEEFKQYRERVRYRLVPGFY